MRAGVARRTRWGVPSSPSSLECSSSSAASGLGSRGKAARRLSDAAESMEGAVLPTP